jgi:hypothetical protein
MAGSLPKGWQSHKFDGPNQPTADSGVVTFHIFDKHCSNIDYGDGRGESDCYNGSVRSTINPLHPYVPLGQTVEYRFDLWIDPKLDFPSFDNPESAAFLPDGKDSRLVVATWEGNLLHNMIYLLKLDSDNGLSFLGHQCQAPADFGNWVSFSMKVRWANDSSGWLKVSCNDKIIYADEDVATNQAPQCYPSAQCEPDTFKDPRHLIFALGPWVWGRMHQGKTPDDRFIPIQADGILIKARNMAVKNGAELYDPADHEAVANLQAALNALGCDVGKPDGVAGRHTKEAALTCRAFPEAKLPGKLTVLTLPTFVSLYTDPAAADLPKGSSGTPSGNGPKIALDYAYTETLPQNGDEVLQVGGKITGTDGGKFPLSFLAVGRFDPSGQAVDGIDMLLNHDLGKPIPDAVTRCPDIRTEHWTDDSTHAVIRFRFSEQGYSTSAGDCIVQALPKEIAPEANFLMHDFAQLAHTIVGGKLMAGIKDPNVAAFISAIGSGKLTIGVD